MNRRGDMEIVINTRILERSIWLVVVLALAVMLWWRWDAAGAHSVATTDERVATLESQLADRDARIATLEAERSTVSPKPAAPATPSSAANPVSPPSSNATNKTGIKETLAYTWVRTGSYPATGKYKLESVTAIVDSTKAEDTKLSYSLCWSSIECERAVAKGTFTAKAGMNTEHELALTIPTYVDVSNSQKLRLIVFDETTKLEVFREDVTIR